jgi:hypothetical protein
MLPLLLLMRPIRALRVDQMLLMKSTLKLQVDMVVVLVVVQKLLVLVLRKKKLHLQKHL